MSFARNSRRQRTCGIATMLTLATFAAIVPSSGFKIYEDRLSQSIRLFRREDVRSSAIIYTAGLFAPDDQDANPKVLTRLAQETGGEAFFPSKPSEVTETCERSARHIRNQYTLGYVSTNAHRDGVYRTIRVSAQAPGHDKLFVRTRSGHIRGAQLTEAKDEDEK